MKIIDLKTKDIDLNKVNELYDMVSETQSSVAIDLHNVENCVTEFFEMFSRLNKRVSLVNVDSKILATLYITGFDKFVHVFEDNLSLEADKYELINRRFTLI